MASTSSWRAGQRHAVWRRQRRQRSLAATATTSSMAASATTMMSGSDGDDLYKVDSLGDVIVELSGIDTVEVTVNGDLVTPYTTVRRASRFTKFTGTGDFSVLAGAFGPDHHRRHRQRPHLKAAVQHSDRRQGRRHLCARFNCAIRSSRRQAKARTPSRQATVSSYTLGANLENLTHTGGIAFIGTGNALDNVITGGTGVDTLSGLDGNDRLISGGDLDTLIGGKGDDVYIDSLERTSPLPNWPARAPTPSPRRQFTNDDARRQCREPVLHRLRQLPRDWQ